MNVLLSIIIPVYKVEAYVQECLDSVFKQIHVGVEVIVVDDGSPDASMEIIKREFQPWLDNGVLILLEQQNMGPGSARNLGLKRARGQYIGYLDSDDILLDGYFNRIVEIISLGEADIIEFGFKRFSQIGQIAVQPCMKLYPMHGLVKLASVRELFFARTRWFPSLRVYRRVVLDGFEFPVGVHYEDLLSIPGIFLQDWLVHFIDEPLLGYRKHQTSITANHTMSEMSCLYDYYRSIPLDSIAPLQILKLSLARGLAYFYCELNPPEFPMREIINDMKFIRLSRSTLKVLTWQDWLFYRAPRIYMMINVLRIPRASGAYQ